MSMQVARRRACSLLLLPALAAAMAPPAHAESNVLFIFDASGSMKKAMPSGASRMDAAKKAMGGALATMPADVRLGLLLYGHRRAKDCTDIELVSPIGADDAKALGARINALTAKGETPIAESLKQGMRSYAALKGQDNRMILVTDGIEECGGNVCAAAQEVRDAGFDLKVDVVGFTLTQEQRALIQCVPDVTGGQYYDAQNMAGLTTALQKAVEAPDHNILAQKHGGWLQAAPGDEWLKLNDGDDKRATTYSGPGVWSFKDGKPATFDTFEVLIPGANQYNLKDFELLVGDEGPLGSFRSIGQFAAQNMKLMKSPYQPFKFEPVTARFLKVVLNTDQGGGYIAGHEFRLQGTVDESAEPWPAAAAPAGGELLAPAAGGTLLAAPNEEWKKLNDGKPERATTYGGEGVWSFKDGKPATFDTFEVLIPATYKYNLKDFELLVGDEGSTGSFRSIGQYSVQNMKLFASGGYQRFTFAPATGRYLKVGFRSDQGGGYIVAHELRLFGTIDATAAAATAVTAPKGVDLLAPANGGMLRAAPEGEWAVLTDGKAARVATSTGDGVWSFKDGKPATFDTFDVFIPGTEQYNLEDFELLVGDEDPLGDFRSIGKFTAQNLKVMPDGWQRFSFAPVTGRFLKVGFRSDHGGGYIAAYGLRLHGTVDESAAAMAPPPPPQGIDLLAQANGGALLGAPKEEWALLNDGKEDGRVATAPGEGIWAFQDEKPATFHTFEVLIHGTNSYNLKDFELLAAVDSPAGPFLSIGQYSTRNLTVLPSGWQRFSFPPVTARYLKVLLKTDHGGGYIAVHEFRLFGQRAP